MYRLTIKNSVYMCPKPSLKFLAMSKAMDLGNKAPLHNKITDDKTAIEFLSKLNIKVEDINE